MNDINLDQAGPVEVPSPSKWWHTAAAIVTTAVATVALLGLVEHEEPAIVAPGSTYDTNEAITVVEFAGTIRNVGGTWQVLNDAGHEPDAITIGTVTATSVRVNNPACSQVISVIVGADNEYAQDFGAKFGASAGLNYFVIEGSISDSGDTGVADDIWDPTTDYTAGTNIWIMGKCLPA